MDFSLLYALFEYASENSENFTRKNIRNFQYTHEANYISSFKRDLVKEKEFIILKDTSISFWATYVNVEIIIKLRNTYNKTEYIIHFPFKATNKDVDFETMTIKNKNIKIDFNDIFIVYELWNWQ